jgi:carboxyl-terminal processing protease
MKKPLPQPKSITDPAVPPIIHVRRAPSWLFIVIALMLGLGFGWVVRGTTITRGSQAVADLAGVKQILKDNFDGDIDGEKMSQGAVRGLVASLGDPYTTFLDKTQSKALSDSLKGELSGIGIEIGLKNNRLTVISPLDGSPAAKAGLRSGDVIGLIGTEDTSEMTLDTAVDKIRGEKGTEVKLTILRGSDKPLELTIVRDTITVSSVKYEVKPGGIGYIRLRQFGDDTDTAIRAATADLAKQGVTKIVLDLRDNPGGYLNSAVTVSSEFLDSGTVVEERSRHSESKTLVANPGGALTKVKLIILVNGGSASAAEIAAGALKDNGRATLVGEKTYGKGSVQEIKNLSDGNQLKVTVAHWYTPKGVNISKEGIAPDVEVKNSSEDYNAGRDPQLDKALELAAQ